MTQQLEQLPVLGSPEISFSKYDRVALVLRGRLGPGQRWQLMNYIIEGQIVGGPEACDEPDKPLVPYVLPDKPLPEGDPFATTHPFKLNLEPFEYTLEDGTTVQLRFKAILTEYAEEANKRFAEAHI